jgi:hypothetical protein
VAILVFAALAVSTSPLCVVGAFGVHLVFVRRSSGLS